MLRYSLRCGATLVILATITAMMAGAQYAYLFSQGLWNPA